MKGRSALYHVCVAWMAVCLSGCSKNPLEPKTQDFDLRSLVNGIRSYGSAADFVAEPLPIDTGSTITPLVSTQSWIVKGKDILVSVTVPADAEEIYFAAVNSQAEYMGLKFSDERGSAAGGYYRLRLLTLKKRSVVTDGYQNFQVVLSSNEDIELSRCDLLVACKTAGGISNVASITLNVIGIAPFQKSLRTGFRPLPGYTYTIRIATPSGGVITYSHNKSSGSESFTTTGPASASLSYDSGLDFKWIDFSSPPFGKYALTATIQVELTGGTQYIYLLLAIVTVGKIGQLTLDANVQKTGTNTAVATGNLGFGYFEGYQVNVLLEEVAKAGVRRIPKNCTQTINVTVLPDPLPQNEHVSLELVTQSGVGEAVFVENNSDTRTLLVDHSRKIVIKGKVTSSAKDNISLLASHDGRLLASQHFSVRTWPEQGTFSLAAHDETFRTNGILLLWYGFDSESGSMEDVYGNLLGEQVTYDGTPSGQDFVYSCPPFRRGLWASNPYDLLLKIGTETCFPPGTPQTRPNQFRDAHHLPLPWPYGPKSWETTAITEAFLSPPECHNYFKSVSRQYYLFKDPVLQIEQRLVGPLLITRTVEYDVAKNRWVYRVAKDGVPVQVAFELP